MSQSGRYVKLPEELNLGVGGTAARALDRDRGVELCWTEVTSYLSACVCVYITSCVVHHRCRCPTTSFVLRPTIVKQRKHTPTHAVICSPPPTNCAHCRTRTSCRITRYSWCVCSDDVASHLSLSLSLVAGVDHVRQSLVGAALGAVWQQHAARLSTHYGQRPQTAFVATLDTSSLLLLSLFFFFFLKIENFS